MSFQRRQGIVPQLGQPFTAGLRRLFSVVTPASALLLAACSTVQLNADKPIEPATVEQARSYVSGRDRALEFLDYELNEQSRACYKRFFVSSCLDDVRLKGAELRRAHLEVLGKAEDLIRMEDYAKRRSRQAN